MTTKFEKKYGKYAIKNLTLYLIIGYVIGYAIYYISPDMYGLLKFNPHMIFQGQIWRLFTWILLLPIGEKLNIFTLIMLLLYYQLGQGLERAWGKYRYNLYIFSGIIFTIIGVFILYAVYGAAFVHQIGLGYEYIGHQIGGMVSPYYINMSIFLAYAITFPNEELLLYFLIPVKLKWFGILYAITAVLEIYGGFAVAPIVGVTVTILIVTSLFNFLLYLIMGRTGQRIQPKQVKRRYDYNKSIKQSKPTRYEDGARHKCAVCGRTELDDPNLTFRYCSKCSGNKEYCQDHLFTHTHN